MRISYKKQDVSKHPVFYIMEREYSVKNKIFHTQDESLRTTGDAQKQRRNGEYHGRKSGKEKMRRSEFGQIQMKIKISLLTIIGEIEGHDCLPATTNDEI